MTHMNWRVRYGHSIWGQSPNWSSSHTRAGVWVTNNGIDCRTPCRSQGGGITCPPDRVAPTIHGTDLVSRFVYGRGDPCGRPGVAWSPSPTLTPMGNLGA